MPFNLNGISLFQSLVCLCYGISCLECVLQGGFDMFIALV
jgi:hypothetical protein